MHLAVKVDQDGSAVNGRLSGMDRMVNALLAAEEEDGEEQGKDDDGLDDGVGRVGTEGEADGRHGDTFFLDLTMGEWCGIMILGVIE